jgi:hypothetical protein
MQGKKLLVLCLSLVLGAGLLVSGCGKKDASQ